MNAGRDVERLIADWLVEEAVPRAPDRVLDAARRSIHGTRQRRTPGAGWLQPRLGPAWRPLAMLLVAALVGAVGFVALGKLPHTVVSTSPSGSPIASTSPSGSPIASPSQPASPSGSSPTSRSSPTDGTRTFTSSRFRYSMALPANFKDAVSSSAKWPLGAAPGAPRDPDVDYFEGTGARQLYMLSWPLARDETPDHWLTAYVAANAAYEPACWPAPARMQRMTIDGQPAWIHGGSRPCDFTEAIVFAGGRVYQFQALVETGLTFNRDLFDTIVSSIRFDP